MEVNKIYNGNCLDVLRSFPDEWIDCVVTSPPYWALRDYGTASWIGGNPECNHRIDRFGNRNVTDKTKINQNQQNRISGEFVADGEKCSKCGAIRKDFQLGLEKTYEEYINKLCDIFDEVKRILKPGGAVWVNLGDTYGTQSGAMMEGKFGPKNTNNQQIIQPKSLHKCLLQIPNRFAIEMVNRGWILRNEIIWHKPNCMPTSVRDRFTVDFEKFFFFVKSKNYYFEPQYEDFAENTFVRTKYGNKESSKMMSGNYAVSSDGYNSYAEKVQEGVIPGRNKRTVWTITTKPYRGAHFATYPVDLIEAPILSTCPEFICNECGKARERIIGLGDVICEGGSDSAKMAGNKDSYVDSGTKCKKMTSREHIMKGYSDCGCGAGFRPGIVLDVFMGSGTTGVGARINNRNYVGIELNPEYIEIAEERIKHYEDEIEEKKSIKSLLDYFGDSDE